MALAKKMIKRALIPLILIICLGATNAFWYLKYIDSSLTIDSLSFDLHIEKRSLNDLKILTLKIDKSISKAELIEIIKENIENPEIFELDGNIYYQNLGFIFENSILSSITTDVPVDPNSKG
ncbi:MAG: hypothetical protein GY699_14090 [Desulfobacteraceae bacterium]|nr:hypothetical protein [Desulfobacteraceae bacterium]